MIDPYPPALLDTELSPAAEPDPLIRAINRLAQAVEQNTLALLNHPAPVRPVVQPMVPQRPALAPLPAVTVVAQKPPCPYHGIAKVQPSSKFPGFYCTAKDASKPRGYCDWTVTTA